ncbi:transposase [Frigoriflavimonas asaccharolytica]|uniref:REP element-mobilizing transposase RayT n=1 Tax=Frigoriflavimonas asaccharolytica TaxID=2735899 RepID=A0A8J8GB23_9FLAO|nr:transposase [Frigoriflavimonas asaccharolytica]NRS93935.1 REP element-mobilizing transposase RayT [Frigoriflavimonas asaccharolytica]
MKTNVFPLETERFYHIYNRGINGGELFFEEQNYFYFLKLLTEKVKPVAKIYSYCLMKNHFHILVRINSEGEIRSGFPDKNDIEIEKIISRQFSNTFNSYSQAINKRFGRTGKLFELPFRRKKIITEQQLVNCILYINKNPAKHKIESDFFKYPYSSIENILSKNNFFVESKEVIDLFDDEINLRIALKNFGV